MPSSSTQMEKVEIPRLNTLRSLYINLVRSAEYKRDRTFKTTVEITLSEIENSLAIRRGIQREEVKRLDSNMRLNRVEEEAFDTLMDMYKTGKLQS